MNHAKALLIAAAVILPATAAQSQSANSPKPDTVQADTAKPDTAKPDTATPDVATLLFSTPMWGKAPVGTKLEYAYTKTVANPKFGSAFDDIASAKLEAGDDADSRVVELRLFTGNNTRPSGPTKSDAENPMLLFALSLNLENIDKIFGVPNPRYLRNAIRKAWRDDAKIEKVDIDVDGKKVAGTRITITPFVNDPEKDKMQGLEGMTYVVETSDSVPGTIAKVDIHAPADGKPAYSEVLRYKGETKS